MDELRNPICLYRCIKKSIMKLRYVSGHDFQTIEEDTPENVHIIKCNVCGATSIAWDWESLEHQK